MAMGTMGLSFAPTAQNEGQNAQQGQTPISDAIKLLSLRIPQFVGAKSIAPSALLNSMGGMGLGGGTPGGLEQWLAQLFANNNGQTGEGSPFGQSQPGPSSPPPPRIGVGSHDGDADAGAGWTNPPPTQPGPPRFPDGRTVGGGPIVRTPRSPFGAGGPRGGQGWQTY